MIIDIHGHVSAPQGLYAWKANQLAARGAHGRTPLKFTDEQLEAALHTTGVFGRGHLDQMDKHGTDLQLISPRPFQLMHSERPAKIVQWWHEEFHNVIAENVRLHPDRFVGIAALPVVAGDPIENALGELERCVKMGFKGCIFNSDPFENDGRQPPPLDDRYWYPFYEKLCELDIPAMLHSAGSKSERENYSTHFITEETIAVVTYCNSKVFEDFPNLKIIIPHGGGAVPYQLGRYQAGTWARPKGERFLDKMRKLWYDCVLYNPESVEFFIKMLGADRIMFGTECPGTGSHLNPETNRACDDVKPSVEKIEWLSAADKKKIFEDNAKQVFKLKV
ncbi:MAG: amidohydrolase family protein [Alphaproteobacteria bacterium]